MKRTSIVIGLATSLAACSAAPDDGAESAQEASFTACGTLPDSWMKTWRLPTGSVSLRVGEARPSGSPRADVLYMHGFSDRMDNHKPLFDEWTNRGARVVSFEYPSHGATCGSGLSLYTMNDLLAFAQLVEQETEEDPDRPLYVAGWSTGGLLATRLAQGARPLTRPLAGAILFAPGVDVHLVLGTVTLESLTSDPAPPHTGPISPTMPATYPVFSTSLLLHGGLARQDTAPPETPTLVFTGGVEQDTYADTLGLKAWVEEQRARGAGIVGVGCEDGKHELDNEAAPIGPTVRALAGEFFQMTLEGEVRPPSELPGCAGF